MKTLFPLLILALSLNAFASQPFNEEAHNNRQAMQAETQALSGYLCSGDEITVCRSAWKWDGAGEDADAKCENQRNASKVGTKKISPALLQVINLHDAQHLPEQFQVDYVGTTYYVLAETAYNIGTCNTSSNSRLDNQRYERPAHGEDDF